MDLILIHGMGRTPLSLVMLRYRLKKLGYRAHLFGYSAAFESLNRVTNRLVALIHRLPNQNYGLIGQSLGTVIIRHALPRLKQQPKVCFLLAPPILACKAAKLFSNVWLYRLLTGEMGQLLGQDAFMNKLTMPDSVKIYAGNAGPRASWLPLGNEVNDGLLTVAEASGRFSHKAMLVPTLHSFIMNSRAIFKDMTTYLEEKS
ncbi:MAG: alpha/beta hydrolase [Leptolyngbyaceae cyanobacterium MAG.088]|nr:alpha/beta hydrolase [Leptolyngbyaceae cyanobacterium MAG.088]